MTPNRRGHMASYIGRRKFLATLGGAAAAWPLAARGQQAARVRRIGVLLPAAADDAEFQARVGAVQQGVALLGWTIGRNVRIDSRWATANVAEIRRHAAELVALAPDIILAHGDTAVGALLQVTRNVPVVFPVVGDPVGGGFVDSLARPGGNVTGFMNFEYSISGKWLELLKEVAPGVTRGAVLRDPAIPNGPAQCGVIQALSPSLRVEVIPVNVGDASEIERAVAAFARSANGGLIVTGSNLVTLHRDLIITRSAISCLRSTMNASSSPPAAWSPMGPISLTNIDVRPPTSIASSGARSPRTCQCRHRPNTSLYSTSRPPRRSLSRSRQRCSPALTW